MRILHTVKSYLPDIHGMSEVVRQISERLVERGHHVVVATRKDPLRSTTIINGVCVKEFDISGSFVSGLTGQIADYQDFLLNSNFDIITNFAAQQWATDIALPLLDQISAKKVFVPTGFSGLYKPEYKQYFQSMPIWLKKYNKIVFSSFTYRDTLFANSLGIHNYIVIPNGASEREFIKDDESLTIRQHLGIPDDHFLILHVGGYTGLKGHREAVEIFLHSNIKKATLLLVAKEFQTTSKKILYHKKNLEFILKSLLSRKSLSFEEFLIRINLPFIIKNRLLDRQVLYTSLSRPETIAAFFGANLFLFPSNIECSPIVLFEALASKTPFLSTNVGNAEEIVNWTNGGRILPSYIDTTGRSHAVIYPSAKLLTDLYNNNELRNEMARDGFDAWDQRFTWKTISYQYEKLYKELLQ